MNLSIDKELTQFDFGAPIQKTERKLPHWQQNGVTYFVTFRLYDSIPAEIIKDINFKRRNWFRNHSDPYTEEEWRKYNFLFSEKIQATLDTGKGDCILKNGKISEIVENALLFFKGDRYSLDKWVIMPNHVHVLLTPIKTNKLDNIIHSWKSFTAHQINKTLNKLGEVWQHESYDHVIRNKKQLLAIEHYILDNPRKAKLSLGQYRISQ